MEPTTAPTTCFETIRRYNDKYCDGMEEERNDCIDDDEFGRNVLLSKSI